MNKNYIWACAISNMICISCFTIIAIAFNKWWIILFSFLFFSYPKTIHEYFRVCDGCGKHSEHTSSNNDAIDKAKAAGWIHITDDNKDYCPECKKKFVR